ncbi:MAG: YvcK family protein [Armatimonadetes bacterium]|nr:YvcK family protein [Armatimonadota bacterium]
MRVKRWLLLVPVGAFAIVVGVVLLANIAVFEYLNSVGRVAFSRFGIRLDQPTTYIPLSLGLIFFGLVLIFVAIRQVIRSIISVVDPRARDKLADVLFQKRYLSQGQRIVVIGGGTGLSTMLRGLKQYTSNIVAIVTVTDDGGSSGKLHRELGMLPPGDIRNCLVALADAEPLMTELFQYRFNGGTGSLQGHSFGNLLIAAMTNITGDFEKAVKETSNILAIRGRVLPSTIENVQLHAELADGSLADGETNIVASRQRIRHIFLTPSDIRPLDESIQAIALADVIIIGPGSVYTSIVPNLLVLGIADAIADSKAEKVYVCNVMTQPGETEGFTAADHVRAVANHSDHRIFNHVLVNRQVPSLELLEKYAEQGAELVAPDIDAVREMGYRVVIGDFMSQTDVVRHDPEKLAQAIIRLAG